MDTYAVLTFLHVLGAIVWVGGGFTVMTLMTWRLVAHGTAEALVAHLQLLRFLGMVAFGPAALVTVLAGLGAMGAGGLELAFWTSYGLAGAVVASLLGALGARRAQQRVLAAPDDHGARNALVGWNLAMSLVLLSVVAMMVFKPTL